MASVEGTRRCLPRGDVCEIITTRKSFAARLSDGSVVTWGNVHEGGDSSAVAAQLYNVCSVAGSDIHQLWDRWRQGSAFAAIRADRSIIAWGHRLYGGDSNSVAAQLHDVVSIVGNGSAFAAIRADMCVVTWGHKEFGGDSSSVQLHDVVSVVSNSVAFAAIRVDRSVVTWGDAEFGGDSSSVQLHDVVSIIGNYFAFAAICADKWVDTWGDAQVWFLQVL